MKRFTQSRQINEYRHFAQNRIVESKPFCRADIIRYIDLFTRLKLKWIGADGTETIKMLRVTLVDVSQSKIVTCGQSAQEKMHSCANAETREKC